MTEEVNNNVNEEEVEVSETENNSSTENEKTKEEQLLEQLEAWKKHARDWEEKAKNNKTALDQTTLETVAKEETITDLAEKVRQMEESLRDAQRVATVNAIAAEYALSAEDAALFLTGEDEETLRKQAKALSERSAVNNGVIPSLSGRGRKTSSDDDLINKLFNL